MPGNVITHASSMFLAMLQFTRLMERLAPTPMMADVLQWPVDTGMPVRLANSSVNTVEKLAATPWYFSSFTMSMPTDLMMRLPPTTVPSRDCQRARDHDPHGEAARVGRGAAEGKRDAQHGDGHELLAVLRTVQKRQRHRAQVLDGGEHDVSRLTVGHLRTRAR